MKRQNSNSPEMNVRRLMLCIVSQLTGITLLTGDVLATMTVNYHACVTSTNSTVQFPMMSCNDTSQVIFVTSAVITWLTQPCFSSITQANPTCQQSIINKVGYQCNWESSCVFSQDFGYTPPVQPLCESQPTGNLVYITYLCLQNSSVVRMSNGQAQIYAGNEYYIQSDAFPQYDLPPVSLHYVCTFTAQPGLSGKLIITITTVTLQLGEGSCNQQLIFHPSTGPDTTYCSTNYSQSTIPLTYSLQDGFIITFTRTYQMEAGNSNASFLLQMTARPSNGSTTLSMLGNLTCTNQQLGLPSTISGTIPPSSMAATITESVETDATITSELETKPFVSNAGAIIGIVIGSIQSIVFGVLTVTAVIILF